MRQEKQIWFKLTNDFLATTTTSQEIFHLPIMIHTYKTQYKFEIFSQHMKLKFLTTDWHVCRSFMGNNSSSHAHLKAYKFLFVHIYSRYTYWVPNQELGHWKYPPSHKIFFSLNDRRPPVKPNMRHRGSYTTTQKKWLTTNEKQKKTRF